MAECAQTAKGDHVIVEQLSPNTILPSLNTATSTDGSDSQLLTLLSQSSAAVSNGNSVALLNNMSSVNPTNGYPEHEALPIAAGYNTYKVPMLNVKRGGSKKSTERRMRATFSSNQTIALEKAFQEKPYLSSEERVQLAKSLGIQENQVKVWFQNRRTKSRRCAWRKKPEDNTRTSESESV